MRSEFLLGTAPALNSLLTKSILTMTISTCLDCDTSHQERYQHDCSLSLHAERTDDIYFTLYSAYQRQAPGRDNGSKVQGSGSVGIHGTRIRITWRKVYRVRVRVGKVNRISGAVYC